MDDNVYFCCEYARSSIGSCKACPKAIPKNAVKIGFTPDFDHCGTIWFHFSCFFKKCFFRKQLKGDTERESVFVGFEDLKETDQERLKKAREKLVLSLTTGKPETKKGKRTADDDDSEWKPHTKKQKITTQSENELTVGKHTYQIQDLLYINISRWKDIVLVGIREYYRPTTGGKLRPGKKGMSLTVDQYRTLIDQKLSISNAIEQIKEDIEGKEAIKLKKQKQKKNKNKKGKQEAAKTDFGISENRRIIVKSEFISGSQQVVVDIREYSTPTAQSGEIQLPTYKGITLTEKQWNIILSLHSIVIRDLADNFGYSEDFADGLSAL